MWGRLSVACALLLAASCGRLGFDQSESNATPDAALADLIDAQPGESCTLNSDCAAACINDRCAPFSPAGGGCDEPADCSDPNLECLSNVCVLRAACTGTQTFGRGGNPGLPGEYSSFDAELLQVANSQAGCTYSFQVEGGGGGRGNHDNPTSNADGGSGGRTVFDFVPGSAGTFSLVVGGGGAGNIGLMTLDDPEPGAGGGGSSAVFFKPVEGSVIPLAIAAGGGGGGWAEVGTNGGGGDNECGDPCDEGSTGGCLGLTGTLHAGGDPGGACPMSNLDEPIPCGGPGGSGSGGGAGGFGVGAGFGGDEVGNQGSGGGGGGFGGGSAGGGAGDPGLGGGGYFNNSRAALVSGSAGGANNAARYVDALALIGGDGRVILTISAPTP
jgi:hypothetical protein